MLDGRVTWRRWAEKRISAVVIAFGSVWSQWPGVIVTPKKARSENDFR